MYDCPKYWLEAVNFLDLSLRQAFHFFNFHFIPSFLPSLLPSFLPFFLPFLPSIPALWLSFCHFLPEAIQERDVNMLIVFFIPLEVFYHIQRIQSKRRSCFLIKNFFLFSCERQVRQRPLGQKRKSGIGKMYVFPFTFHLKRFCVYFSGCFNDLMSEVFCATYGNIMTVELA